MKKITIFVQRYCPYCQRALQYIRQLQTEVGYPELEFELIDELAEPRLAAAYDYYYVPTFYWGQKKLYEGAIDKAGTQALLDSLSHDE